MVDADEAALLDALEDEEPTTEIVHWYHDPFWRVPFVPTAVAFTAGALIGAAVALLAVKAMED